MADNGDGVLEAVRTLRRCLERAINFSTKYPNCALDSLKRDELVDFIERANSDHKAWDSEYHAALQTLVGPKPLAPEYPFPKSWCVDISTPQIAICAFVDCFAPGGGGYEAYIFGGGDNYITDKKTPASVTLEPNTFHDVDWPDLEANQPHNWCGVFDDSIVREWERVLESIVTEERELYRAQLRWSTQSKEAEDAVKPAIEILRQHGRRMTKDELLFALDQKGMPSSSSIAEAFARAVKAGDMTNTKREDKFGKGYGLPEWL